MGNTKKQNKINKKKNQRLWKRDACEWTWNEWRLHQKVKMED